MKTDDAKSACPRCGAPVPAEAPEGLCPKCVLAAAAATEASPTATSQIPSLERLAAAFPQLQVIELIGRGAMGFVFKARQPHLDRFVALKLLPDSLAGDPQFAERFNREGRMLARLSHPNIVSIFDFGQAGGFCYLLMEYVDGVNLREAMQAGKFSPSEALTIVPKICEALQFAHGEGILHRDIKPENILLDTRGRVKIADFGIAKLVAEEAERHLTATGAAIGTPHYMAPEQIEKPSSVDHRADIYSLGVVFYEMLTGELPLGRFSPPSHRTPVDPRVDDVVMRTLEKEREKRFQTAGEVKTHVERLTDAGAGATGTTQAKPAPAEAEPRKTVVDIPPAIPAWSRKAIWGAALVSFSLVWVVFIVILLGNYFAANRTIRGSLVPIVPVLGILASLLPALAGTILGWMGLSDVRAHHGRLRGLPIAVFAAMAWPTLLLLGLSGFTAAFALHFIAIPSPSMVLLLLPAGMVTFTIWAIYTAGRWGANQPPSRERGVLKWIFLALLLSICGLAFLPRSGMGKRHGGTGRTSPFPPDVLTPQPTATPEMPQSTNTNSGLNR